MKYLITWHAWPKGDFTEKACGSQRVNGLCNRQNANSCTEEIGSAKGNCLICIIVRSGGKFRR